MRFTDDALAEGASVGGEGFGVVIKNSERDRQ